MKPKLDQSWTADQLLELGRGYQAAAVFAAAADLDLFSAVGGSGRTDAELAAQLGCDDRGLVILLDALTALGLLRKENGRYSLPEGTSSLLTAGSSASILPMAQHQGTCLRRWAQLATVVKTGRPANPISSVRGEQGDLEAFIGAMHAISAPTAEAVISGVRPLHFRHLLDIGGGSGTWTIAFLRACSGSTATLFDLAAVIPMAQRRLDGAGLGARVSLVAGDFLNDALPPGADLAWVSAIVHQNSRAQNRRLFASLFRAMVPGGRVVIRDMVMEESRTHPVAGALFAVNMLVATEGGATYTFTELSEDLSHEGFVEAKVLRQDQGMNALVSAIKPAA